MYTMAVAHPPSALVKVALGLCWLTPVVSEVYFFLTPSSLCNNLSGGQSPSLDCQRGTTPRSKQLSRWNGNIRMTKKEKERERGKKRKSEKGVRERERETDETETQRGGKKGKTEMSKAGDSGARMRWQCQLQMSFYRFTPYSQPLYVPKVVGSQGSWADYVPKVRPTNFQGLSHDCCLWTLNTHFPLGSVWLVPGFTAVPIAQ